jgi:molybdopterin synthase catalytic subunit
VNPRLLDLLVKENLLTSDQAQKAVTDQRRSGERLATVLEDVPVVMAVNREYANEQTPLAEDDELALLPPVSGGAGEYVAHARVTAEPLSVAALIARVP